MSLAYGLRTRPSGVADVPRAVWEHSCWVTGRTKQRDERWTCFRCRERAKLVSLSYSVTERMGRYSRTYGLGSVGLHRGLADSLLNDITVIRCEPCGGSGDRIVGDEDVSDCWPCAGTGVAPECWDAIARVRAQVIEAYPDSARPYPPERSSVVWQPRSAPIAMSTMGTGDSLHVWVITAILVPLGLGGGVALLNKGRVIDGLFLLDLGASMAFMALLASGAMTLRLRTARVVVLVLLVVFVLLFVLVVGHGAANAPG